MDEQERFFLLQAKREVHDPMELAKALAAARSTPVLDQVLAAKRAWGIVAEDLSRSEVTALGLALRSSGIECVAGPAGALRQLPPAEAAATVAMLRDVTPILIAVAGITIRSIASKTEQKGPSGAQKIASAAIMAGTGLPIKIGGRKRTVETTVEKEDLVFFADIYCETPTRRMRIEASRFDYSFLGERMLYQAQANLKALIGDIVAGAPKAWLNHGTKVLLEGRPVRTMGYGSLEDLEREARWLLTLRAAGLGG